MSDKSTEKSIDAKELKADIDNMNKKWTQNPFLFFGSLTIGIAVFITAFFVPREGFWLNLLQTIFFLGGVGLIILPFSYLFNVLWKSTLKN